MIAAMILASLAGSFAMARFYGMGWALTALGLSWGSFAWFPQVLAWTAPAAVAAIAALLALGLLRERRRGAA
ncbi:hypothetical protein [Paracraurococcus lichenis]|uniref:Uncharacterized protein n=1 Tax=Paracraurococcus lichenis TaxID=3064888 RepID=A0ABT9E4W4_9PROT|nr:hypothetical protein [Paracraurococcus sp. LOR1-02]MDO9711220.1 hypothetical protein [Paracraurococcus sp. LOR1-02]